MYSLFLSLALLQPPAHVVPSQQTPAPAVPAVPTEGTIVRIPKTITMVAGDLVIVTAESGAELVTWDATDGLTVTLPKPYDPAMKRVAVHAKENGTYALSASIPHGKETRVSICLVTVGPRPPPPLPDPIDTLLEALKALYKPEMREDVLQLASVYRMGAKTATDDPNLKTNADLSAVMAKAANTVVPLPKLEELRRFIQAEVIVKNFPNPQAPLTPGTRTAWKVQFQRIATVLEELAGVKPIEKVKE